MIPNLRRRRGFTIVVVNCFQNCIFTYDSQHFGFKGTRRICCELLSELYFYLWFPTLKHVISIADLLWIAFRIVFLLMIPNGKNSFLSGPTVVNCFQNCIFTYDSQLMSEKKTTVKCCELLSELYFYLWFPTQYQITKYDT